MQHLTLTMQIASSIAAMGLTMAVHFTLNNFKHIWTVEFGNKWNWRFWG